MKRFKVTTVNAAGVVNATWEVDAEDVLTAALKPLYGAPSHIVEIIHPSMIDWKRVPRFAGSFFESAKQAFAEVEAAERYEDELAYRAEVAAGA